MSPIEISALSSKISYLYRYVHPGLNVIVQGHYCAGARVLTVLRFGSVWSRQTGFSHLNVPSVLPPSLGLPNIFGAPA